MLSSFESTYLPFKCNILYIFTYVNNFYQILENLIAKTPYWFMTLFILFFHIDHGKSKNVITIAILLLPRREILPPILW